MKKYLAQITKTTNDTSFQNIMDSSSNTIYNSKHLSSSIKTRQGINSSQYKPELNLSSFTPFRNSLDNSTKVSIENNNTYRKKNSKLSTTQA